MTRRFMRLGLLVSVIGSVTVPPSSDAHAGDITVFAAGATKEVEIRISPSLAEAGIRVVPQYDTVGALRDRVLHGEHADVVLLSDTAISALEAKGLLAGEPPEKMGLIAVALAVKRGGTAPDISTAEALKSALLAAKSIAFADPARGATAGTHFGQVLDALGIRQQILNRLAVLPFGIDVIDAVGSGRFELGVSQSSEIALHSGVTLVGRLPSPYALTTSYSAATTKNAAPGAEAFLKKLREPIGQQAIKGAGFSNY